MRSDLALDLLRLLERNPVHVTASVAVRYAQIVMALQADANPSAANQPDMDRPTESLN